MSTPTLKQKEEILKSIQVTLSKGTVYSISEASVIARNEGRKIASFGGVVMNQPFIIANKESVVVVSSKGAPETEGWYRINRQKGALEPKGCFDDVRRLQWHERVYIYVNVAEVIKGPKVNKEERLLTLTHHKGPFTMGLYLDLAILWGDSAKVALESQIKPSVRSKPKELNILRPPGEDTVVVDWSGPNGMLP
jgi:hypothetical protein